MFSTNTDVYHGVQTFYYTARIISYPFLWKFVYNKETFLFSLGVVEDFIMRVSLLYGAWPVVLCMRLKIFPSAVNEIRRAICTQAHIGMDALRENEKCNLMYSIRLYLMQCQMRAIHTAQGINQSICKASQFWMYNFTDKENAVQLHFCHRNKNPPHTQVQVTIYAIGHLNGSCELGLFPRILVCVQL